MFTADAFIDTVQTGKKTWVNTFVTNEATKDAMINFIDSQADYTKKAIKATTDAAATVASETVKAMQEATTLQTPENTKGHSKKTPKWRRPANMATPMPICMDRAASYHIGVMVSEGLKHLLFNLPADQDGLLACFPECQQKHWGWRRHNDWAFFLSQIF